MLSEDEPSTQINFKISPRDLRVINIAAKKYGLDRSKYIRKCVLMHANNPEELQIAKLNKEIEEDEINLTVKKSFRDNLIETFNANKTVAENIEQATDREIESLISTLKIHSGRLVDIKHFIRIRVDTINNSYQTKDIKPLTIEKFTEKLREVAESQGVTCK